MFSPILYKSASLGMFNYMRDFQDSLSKLEQTVIARRE